MNIELNNNNESSDKYLPIIETMEDNITYDITNVVNLINKDKIKDELYKITYKFMMDNEITCDETIHQCDHVIVNAYDFISELYNCIKSDLPEIDD